jgi:geranylgeranyl pyrophosphate synthase
MNFFNEEAILLDNIHKNLKDMVVNYVPTIESSLKTIFKKNHALDNSINYSLLSNAKRFRAALVFIVLESFGKNKISGLPVAIAFELLHTSSLVHDDIMDNSKYRRGKLCNHEVFGNSVAITAGDGMIFEAYNQILKLTTNFKKNTVYEIFKVFNDCCYMTCKGQIEDITFPGINGSIDNYLKMVQRKTGSMIESSFEAGALLACAKKDVVREFRLIGRNLGIIFQLIDDAIDYFGKEENALKTVGNDIIKNRGSAILLHCYNSCNSIEKDLITESIELYKTKKEQKHINNIYELITKYDAVKFSKKLCKRYLDKSKKSFNLVKKSLKNHEYIENIFDTFSTWAK